MKRTITLYPCSNVTLKDAASPFSERTCSPGIWSGSTTSQLHLLLHIPNKPAAPPARHQRPTPTPPLPVSYIPASPSNPSVSHSPSPTLSEQCRLAQSSSRPCTTITPLTPIQTSPMAHIYQSRPRPATSHPTLSTACPPPNRHTPPQTAATRPCRTSSSRRSPLSPTYRKTTIRGPHPRASTAASRRRYTRAQCLLPVRCRGTTTLARRCSWGCLRLVPPFLICPIRPKH